MSKMIFINLPVTDVERSARFYEAVGATRDARFGDAGGAAAMAFSDAIVVMLLSHDQFMQFSPRPIGDVRATAQALISLFEESREAVDSVVERAVAAGGKADPSPVDDYGFMYGRGFEDPDGHIFGVAWMDAEAMAKAQAGAGSPEAA